MWAFGCQRQSRAYGCVFDSTVGVWTQLEFVGEIQTTTPLVVLISKICLGMQLWEVEWLLLPPWYFQPLWTPSGIPKVKLWFCESIHATWAAGTMVELMGYGLKINWEYSCSQNFGEVGTKENLPKRLSNLGLITSKFHKHPWRTYWCKCAPSSSFGVEQRIEG